MWFTVCFHIAKCKRVFRNPVSHGQRQRGAALLCYLPDVFIVVRSSAARGSSHCTWRESEADVTPSFDHEAAMLIPVLMVFDVPEAIAFYTGVLDFALAFASPPDAPFYAVLTRGADELHLNLVPDGRRGGGSSTVVVCDEVDALFASFIARGLVVPTRANSPVHEGPLDQTWGTREVYIDDPSGNTLIFQRR
mgnify:CR=1 FL=1